MADTNTTLQKFKQEHYELQKEHQHQIKAMENLRKELEKMKDENERLKQKLPETQREPLTTQFWQEVTKKVREHNTDFIKQLINNKKLDMMDTDSKGQTLLILAARSGCYELVQLCINLDADINVTDKLGKTALDHSRSGAWTHVERLLIFSKMKANVGDSIVNSANIMNRQKGVIENILNQLNHYTKSKKIFKDTVIDLMIGIIENKLAFSDDLLNLAWEFACGDMVGVNINKPNDTPNSSKRTNPLSTKLWKSIEKTCKNVIEHGNKRDWFWFKQFIVPSTIWFKDISAFGRLGDKLFNIDSLQSPADDDVVNGSTPTEKKETSFDYDVTDSKMDVHSMQLSGLEKLQNVDSMIMKSESIEMKNNNNNNADYVYYQLLKLVDDEAETDLQELENNLNQFIQQQPDNWNTLVNWDLDLSNVVADGIVRQNRVPNAIPLKHTFEELTKCGVSGTKFNTHSHYDLNQYLPELVLLAHIVDDDFQHSVCGIFDIDKATNTGLIKTQVDDSDHDEKSSTAEIKFMRGPVKLMERARAKAENDYANGEYPTSALVLDLNRCALVFDDISSLLTGLNIFVNKIRYYQSGNIIGIMRVKNGFVEYTKQTQYADIKLNVLIKGPRSNLVGEVQFLLETMLMFKKKAHNLYAVQRQEEYMQSSVKQILPLLLDDKKELFVAGNAGDIKSLCRLMVLNNKTDKDLMQIDEESQETILTNICALNHNKTLRFLSDKSIVRRELLIERLFHSNRYNSTPIEAAVHRFGSIMMIKTIFALPEVIKTYKTDHCQLYRLLMTMYRPFTYSSRHNIVTYILSKLNLSREILIKMMNFEYPSNRDSEKQQKSANKFINQMLIQSIALTGHLDAVSSFAKSVGEKVFMDDIINKTDFLNVASFEYCILEHGRKNKRRDVMNVITYFLSHSFVIRSIQENMNTLFRIVFCILCCHKTDIFEYIINTLELDKNDKLLKVLKFEGHVGYSNTNTKTKLKSVKARTYDEKLMVIAMKNKHIDACKKMIEIIGEKEFADLLFESNKYNVNAWECAIWKSSLEMVEWLLSIKLIKQYILNPNEKEILFRTIFWCLSRFRENIFDLIKKELQITDKILTQLLSYRPRKPTVGTFDVRAKPYWDKGLIVVALTSYDIVIVQQLVDMVNPFDFAKQVFAPNRNNLTVLEFLIQKCKYEMIVFVIKLEAVQNILLKNDEYLFRIIYWMFRKYNANIFDLIVATLNLNKDIFIRLLNFKANNTDNDDDDMKRDDDDMKRDDDGNDQQKSVRYQYWRYNFAQASICCSIECMKKLMLYIDEDLFVSKLFDKNEINVNGIESSATKIDKLNFIFSLNGLCNMINSKSLIFELVRYRLICYSGKYSNDECFNYILSKCNANDDQELRKILTFNYPKKEFDAQNFYKSDHLEMYHDKTLFSWIAASLKPKRIFKILTLIPKDKFLLYLLRQHSNETLTTSFGYLVEKNQVDLVTDIMKMIEKQNDKRILIESTIHLVVDKDLKKQFEQLLTTNT